jgi:hypothetical protein
MRSKYWAENIRFHVLGSSALADDYEGPAHAHYLAGPHDKVITGHLYPFAKFIEAVHRISTV